MFLLFTPFYIINSVFISKNQISKQKKNSMHLFSRTSAFKTKIKRIKKFYNFLEIFILFGTVSPISAESS